MNFWAQYWANAIVISAYFFKFAFLMIWMLFSMGLLLAEGKVNIGFRLLGAILISMWVVFVVTLAQTNTW